MAARLAAGLLGKPAAVFVPSGTMAQQCVLRVHAGRRRRRTVVFHPMCHLDRHEGQAYQRLHGLTGRPAGAPDRLMTIGDLTAIAEPPAALLIELPQRDLGGQQPGLARAAGPSRMGQRPRSRCPPRRCPPVGVRRRVRPAAR